MGECLANVSRVDWIPVDVDHVSALVQVCAKQCIWVLILVWLNVDCVFWVPIPGVKVACCGRGLYMGYVQSCFWLCLWCHWTVGGVSYSIVDMCLCFSEWVVVVVSGRLISGRLMGSPVVAVHTSVAGSWAAVCWKLMPRHSTKHSCGNSTNAPTSWFPVRAGNKCPSKARTLSDGPTCCLDWLLVLLSKGMNPAYLSMCSCNIKVTEVYSL